MKRPYRQGDWFAVPLPGGAIAAGLVTRGSRGVLSGYFFGRTGGVPGVERLSQLKPADATWAGRFFDESLVRLRWHRIGAQPNFAPADWPEPAGDPADAAFVERILAAAGNGAVHTRPRRCVRDLSARFDEAVLAALPPDARLQWRRRIDGNEVDVVARWFARRPRATMRLYGAATAQLAEFPPDAVPARLHVDGTAWTSKGAPLPNVTHLELDGTPGALHELLDAFPNVETLRIAARGAAIDVSAFARAPRLANLELRSGRVIAAQTLPPLRALDIASCDVDDLDAVLRLERLIALRLKQLGPVRSIAALAHRQTLRVLVIDGLLHLDSVEALRTLPALESLDLAGLWQFDIAGVAFVAEMPTLRALRVDIGGRRKNVEIYKRVRLPKPAVFDVETVATI